MSRLRTRRLGSPWLLGLAMLAGLGCRVADDPQSGDAASPAPEFVLDQLAGTPISLAELRGRVVVVDFWATWCGPCVFQIPVLNAFHAAHADDGVVVLGVSVDAGERDVVAEFAAEHEIAYPVLFGDEALAQRYGAVGFPSLYVIDRDGMVTESHVGLVSEEELETAVAAARQRR